MVSYFFIDYFSFFPNRLPKFPLYRAIQIDNIEFEQSRSLFIHHQGKKLCPAARNSQINITSLPIVTSCS